ncbi:hypothetical protein NIES21_29820 [Anabaenopsis circularis NIES-21]|uniref:Uncharacterized protein n=1 Tax=Anabaenopsis circularis NIES-21 TaxID=1085406 RepID=A0A1Z4GI13_9CYAN|nr:hypothetical protein NIES21_29820 [Anabaenopsis circularis NIES-21]
MTKTIRNSQFAIRNCEQNWKLIHSGLQAPQFIDEKSEIFINIQAHAFRHGVIIANCELEIANWR